MKIAIGCDPNAEEAKQELMVFLQKEQLGDLVDFGSSDVIYAHVAQKVAEAVVSGEYDRGILLCGTGIGMCIAANKVKGAYAALLADTYSAQKASLSNCANIACLGAFTTGRKVREEIIREFLTHSFVEGSPSQIKVDAYVQYDMERK